MASSRMSKAALRRAQKHQNKTIRRLLVGQGERMHFQGLDRHSANVKNVDLYFKHNMARKADVKNFKPEPLALPLDTGHLERAKRGLKETLLARIEPTDPKEILRSQQALGEEVSRPYHVP